ncbi:MAG: aminotransferase class III-fold pyridoxal phosphate-dependent enzyme [Candidatus Sericytochromatia bacterium]|uniref:Aminotransferase class III-fold pyridoxal phosphate-dependent enzyme n=1 Tax=Candidatus Tanganyikabacteria bacterium TaxID=2961651 RepID=A0A937X660_9BACT|nr:aminotransferase class III-fold pyridoxal phosphate-dependent enzyme [Candidatus Tanganyikabacteria bacterium]
MDLGGAGKLYGVKPDLVCVGKAMANGYPIAAVCGIRDVMKLAEKQVFISSTYFPNSLEMAAALKTIEILQRDNVLDVVRQKGEGFVRRLSDLVDRSGVPAHVSPVPQMPFITFPEDPADPAKAYRKRRTTFYTEIIRRGVFLQPYHHGYICYRHTDSDLEQAVRAVEAALAIVKDEVG